MPDTRQALEAVKAALIVLATLLGVASLILAGALVVGLFIRLALWAAGA